VKFSLRSSLSSSRSFLGIIKFIMKFLGFVMQFIIVLKWIRNSSCGYMFIQVHHAALHPIHRVVRKTAHNAAHQVVEQFTMQFAVYPEVQRP
jgi:hypothetical protein